MLARPVYYPGMTEEEPRGRENGQARRPGGRGSPQGGSGAAGEETSRRTPSCLTMKRILLNIGLLGAMTLVALLALVLTALVVLGAASLLERVDGGNSCVPMG